MYLYINPETQILMEILPEEDEQFPGIPITERYSQEYLNQCIIRTPTQIDEQGIVVGMQYDKEKDSWSVPPMPEPEPEPTPEPGSAPEQPTWAERIEALERGNKTLQAQLEASIQSNQMLEDCLVEMAGAVYT
jgi:hypothetical protein